MIRSIFKQSWESVVSPEEEKSLQWKYSKKGRLWCALPHQFQLCFHCAYFFHLRGKNTRSFTRFIFLGSYNYIPCRLWPYLVQES